jgi:hypothetical protein
MSVRASVELVQVPASTSQAFRGSVADDYDTTAGCRRLVGGAAYVLRTEWHRAHADRRFLQLHRMDTRGLSGVR